MKEFTIKDVEMENTGGNCYVMSAAVTFNYNDTTVYYTVSDDVWCLHYCKPTDSLGNLTFEDSETTIAYGFFECPNEYYTTMTDVLNDLQKLYESKVH